MLQENKQRVKSVSESDVETVLSDYFQCCEFKQSETGFSNFDEDWKKEPVNVDCGNALFRVLDTVEDCVILRPGDEDCEWFSSVCVSGFDDTVLGVYQHDSNSNEIRVVSDLLVLYSSAILISRYEKEVSTRVLQGCDDTIVESVNRKLGKQRKQFKKRVESGVLDSVIPVNEVVCEVLNVDLESSYSDLCDF